MIDFIQKNQKIILFVGCTALLFLAFYGFSSLSKKKSPHPFVIKKVSTPLKQVALTFDDGPHPQYTEAVLNILKKENIKATFFMLGKQIELFPHIAKRVLDDGHTVGNHSFAHLDYSLYPKAAIKKDIQKSNRIFKEYLSIEPIYFRPPFGRVSTENLSILKSHFKHVIKWSIDTRDWDKETSKKNMVKHIGENVEPGSIIIFHDTHRYTPQELPIIIQELKNRGYKMVTVSDLIK
ncbi:MAG: polysaccharide deacetylase family protein [Candidatus Margulisbacteria bacterium]|nr:polysaccharide deacetylase family protein [Candidatus Margulisiibacteriota bacterium]